MPDRIRSAGDIDRMLASLVRQDPSLVPILERAGTVPLRLSTPDFRGLANIVVAQQVSVASANAIWGRIEQHLGNVCADSLFGKTDEELRSYGLSKSKISTLRTISNAELGGELDFCELVDMDLVEAIAILIELKGIGPWTAEIFMMFCVGHCDIFPAGDLALQKAVGHAKGWKIRPTELQVREHAVAWSPYQSVAARLFWSYYRAVHQKEGFQL